MSSGEEEQVYELKDLMVYEVSPVDRPANRRKFLIVKSEDKMAKGAKLEKGEDGSLHEAGESGSDADSTETAGTSGEGTANEGAGAGDEGAGSEIVEEPEVEEGAGDEDSGDADVDGDADEDEIPFEKAIETVAKALGEKGGDLPVSHFAHLRTIAAFVSKYDPSVQKGATKADQKLRDEISKLADIVKSQSDEIKRLKGARPDSNASPAGEGNREPASKSNTYWPDNLNEPEPEPEDLF